MNSLYIPTYVEVEFLGRNLILPKNFGIYIIGSTNPLFLPLLRRWWQLFLKYSYGVKQ